MRISHGVRAVLAAAWLVAAAAGCSSTVDGVATGPGCGSGTEPDFPTPRPTTSAPPTSSTPSNTPEAPSGAEILAPNENGYVYIETRSGKTRCQISADTVGCESEFTDSPVIDGEHATGVEVSADGGNRWVLGNLGAMPTTTIGYATYSAVGWTIEADSSGTRFTNDGSGHGMFVSTGGVEFF
ncbi:MAG: hypothetical protein ACR2JM_11830 [Mycobacterium sp.]